MNVGREVSHRLDRINIWMMPVLQDYTTVRINFDPEKELVCYVSKRGSRVKPNSKIGNEGFKRVSSVSTNPHVSKYQYAPYNEGGEGVTVVKFKE